MSIRFSCPVCAYHIKAPDGTFGRRGHCPRCKMMIRVPKEDEMEELPPRETGQKPSPAQDARSEDID